MAESSTVARWELALRIKKRRDELDIKAEFLAKQLGFTRNFFSAVENERAMLAEDKLEILMELLRLDNVERSEYRELSRSARTKGWWEPHQQTFGELGTRFLGLEHGASTIRTFDALMVPGFLQTDDYYEAILRRDPLVGRAQTEVLAKVRRKRQREILDGSRVLTALVSEAALHQVWGTRDTLQSQLAYLHRVIDELSLDVRVLAFEQHPGLIACASTVAFFEFSSRNLPGAAYQEAPRPLQILTDGDEEYRRLRISWDEGYELALAPAESLDLIAGLAGS